MAATTPRTSGATTPPTPGAAPALQAVDLHRAYGPVRAVDGVSVTIAAGEVVALLGPNGAGKSTTVDMLLGLARPDSGSVRVFGHDPAEACRRGLVGATLQAGGVIDMVTVRELVDGLRSLSPHPLPLEEVLHMAQVADIADRRTDKLSGGQTQRVRFAMSIAGNPDLLVLDEPTVAMDVATRAQFWSTMRAWAAQGRTVLFATHYLEEADDFADRVVMMARGKVVADGATTEIRAQVTGRTITATLPGVAEAELAALPGVVTAERHGEAVVLRCADSDTTLRALLEAHATVRDIEIKGAGLEEAFLALTDDRADHRADEEAAA